MNNRSSHPYRIITLLMLTGIILLVGISLSGFSQNLQTTPAATPTPTPSPDSGETPLKSGETQPLIWGAGVIMLIIICGVLIQRLILNSDSRKTAETK
jgi:hypothetical protein